MKKISILLLSVLMVFSFVACDNDTPAPDSVSMIENVTTGKKYVALKDAFSEVEKDQELKLLKDVSITTADLPLVFKDETLDGLGFTLVDAVFNGDGHTIAIADSSVSSLNALTGFFYLLENATVKNCVFDLAFNEASTTVYAKKNTHFEDVTVKGDLKFGNNCGAFVIYAYPGNGKDSIEFKNCDVAANMRGDGTAYCAAFVGYALPSSSTNNIFRFEDCKMTGTLNTGVASIFIGNTSQIQKYPYEVQISNFKFGENGQVRFVKTDSSWNFNGIVSASTYNNATITIDGNKYQYNDLDAEKATLWGDHFVFGPEDSTLKFVRTSDKDTFTLTVSEHSDVVRYEVSLKTYSTLKEGGTLYQGVVENIDASSIEGDSIETKLRDLNFVDKTWLENNPSAKKGELAGNVTYELNDVTYYMIPDNESATLNGSPRAISTYIVSAFDANGKLVSSCSLS